MSNKVVLFGDLMSQPTRAVLWFMILNKIPYEFRLISIGKMEQRSKEFEKICPFKKLPVIQYENQTLFESHTILRWLSQQFKLPQYYDYNDLNNRCKVDMYLDWHHLGLRKATAGLFFQKFILPKFGKPESVDMVKDAEFNIPKAFKEIESIFLLNGKNNYLIGENVTIADFSCYCEINQLEALSFDFTPYPTLTNWMERMKQLEGFKESHKIIHKIASQPKL
ncbi:hypothetical protein ACTA71_001635 [Dictyostelium dimigraforme]